MTFNTQIIKQVLLAINKKLYGLSAISQNSLGITVFDKKSVFFHTELLFKKGYISIFNHCLTSDHRHTFFVGGLTKKGNQLVNQIKNTNTWEKEILKEAPNILEQNFSYYLPPHIDGDLWRYMSIDKLKSLLSSSSIYFCRSDLLGDPFEGSTSKLTIMNRPNFFEGATKQFIEKGISNMQKMWGQCIYMSCWHLNTYESALMWRAYGTDNKCISVRTTIKNLTESIICSDKQFILSPIHYVDYTQDYISEANAFEPYIHKQKQYESEREFRLITDNLEKIGDILNKKAVSPNGLFVDIDIKSLIQSIVISPYSDEKFKEEVNELLISYKLLDRKRESSILLEPEF